MACKVQFIIICFLFFVFKVLGYKLSSNLGFFIGKTFGPLFRSKKLVIENLKKSNIQLKKNYNNSANEIFGNYGRIFAEYPFIKNFRKGNLERYIEIDGKKHLDEIKSKNKKVVFISGHFNNFELMAMEIEKSGVDLSAIYRPLNNIFLISFMDYESIKFLLYLLPLPTCSKIVSQLSKILINASPTFNSVSETLVCCNSAFILADISLMKSSSCIF